jgi:hypothetical protein
MLDIKVTHGSYWYGAQLPYWIYTALTVIPFTGLFGIDHLALRSPLTALLKGILNVPLLGYWYFYDIAQALGERDRLEKYGIAVPFYGPTGIGAGIFSGNKKIPVSPKQVPRPWTYMIYVLTTCFFIAFPINKLVIGDYWGALAQVIMYLCFFTIITPILAVAWGLYDVYRVGFDTKGLFDKGPARFLPASWIISPYFKRDVLGPLDPYSMSPSSWLGRVIQAWWEVPIQTGKAVSNTIAEAGKVTTSVVAEAGKETNEVIKEAGDIVQGAEGVVQNAEETAKTIVKSPATGKLVNATLEFSKAAAHEVADAAKEVGDRAINTGKRVSERVPVIVGKVATGAVHDIAKDTVEPITKAVIETKQEVEKVANNATRIAGEVTETAKNVAQNAKNTVSEIGNKALNTADNISQNARKIVNETAGPMPGIVANYANQAKQVGTNVGAQATQAGTNAIQNATQVAQQTTNAIENTAQAATQAANTAVQNASQAIENTSQAIQNTSQAATQAANAAVKNASQAVQETTNAIENTTVAATQATANAVQGTTEALAQNTRNIGAAANATTQALGKNTQQLAAALNATAEELAKKAEQSTEQVVSNTAQGVSGLSSLAAKVPQLGLEVATELPGKIAEHAKVAGQAGGAILEATASSSDPSFTVIIVLFSLGFVAMSGYLFYTLRNLDKQQVEKSDDPPGEPRAVRESDKPRK